MKVNQIIDEMQASLTKLRGQIRSKETTRTCVGTCGGKAREGSNYCQSCMDTRILDTVGERLTGTTGGCILCGFKHPKLHPAFASSIPKDVIDKLIETPDFPLHVRVAKALGWKPYYGNGEWYCQHPLSPPVGIGGTVINQQSFEACKVKDYPNDLTAAMGALEEYCRKVGIRWVIFGGFKKGNKYHVAIIDDDLHNSEAATYYKQDDLPQAICEAIVAHAEGK